MKKIISLIILLIILFLGIEFLVTKFTKSYEASYTLYKDELEFKILEKYSKENKDTYNIEIKEKDNSFYYSIDNTFNKQKKIITDVLYFNDGDNMCIYPVLKNNYNSYIECISNNKLYTGYTYPNQTFIYSINNELKEKGLIKENANDIEKKIVYRKNTLYKNNIKDTDTVLVWQYKGIYYLNKYDQTNVMSITFDKYDNKVGVLVGKYYLIPNYKNSKILEFSSYNVIDLTTLKQTTLDFNYVLSSDTYINGVVDGKLYVTDPSNLTQLEINPKNKKVKLLGDKELGGRLYDGEWKDTNIYDFQSREIKFKNLIDVPKYDYVDIIEGGSSYYFYTRDGSIYQILKGYLDKPILIYQAPELNNFNVVDDDIYFVLGNTVYNYNNSFGVKDILVNNDLIYNTNNRIAIFRGK